MRKMTTSSLAKLHDDDDDNGYCTSSSSSSIHSDDSSLPVIDLSKVRPLRMVSAVSAATSLPASVGHSHQGSVQIRWLQKEDIRKILLNGSACKDSQPIAANNMGTTNNNNNSKATIVDTPPVLMAATTAATRSTLTTNSSSCTASLLDKRQQQPLPLPHLVRHGVDQDAHNRGNKNNKSHICPSFNRQSQQKESNELIIESSAVPSAAGQVNNDNNDETLLWEEYYYQLAYFKATKGHTHVPLDYVCEDDHNLQLSRWVSEQRAEILSARLQAQEKNQKLAPDIQCRIQKLKDIGLDLSGASSCSHSNDDDDDDELQSRRPHQQHNDGGFPMVVAATAAALAIGGDYDGLDNDDHDGNISDLQQQQQQQASMQWRNPLQQAFLTRHYEEDNIEIGTSQAEPTFNSRKRFDTTIDPSPRIKPVYELNQTRCECAVSKPCPVPPRGIGPVNEPNQHDVLCNGHDVINHPGNNHYKQLVAASIPDYLARMNKNVAAGIHVAAGIVQVIRRMKPAGCFLKRDPKNGAWYDIGDANAIHKVLRALQQKARCHNKILKISNDMYDDVNMIETVNYEHLDAHKDVVESPLSPTKARDQSDELPLEKQHTTNECTVFIPLPPQLPPRRSMGQASEPNKFDVLCGRGPGVHNHAGNVLLRRLVAARKSADYFSLPKHVAAEIVQFIRQDQELSGRFLKQDPNDGSWSEIGDAKAIHKVALALYGLPIRHAVKQPAVIEPNQFDVLCGRGPLVNNHAGNVLLRSLVSERKSDYLADQKKEWLVAADIVQFIRRHQKQVGRFLKQGPESNGVWYDIGDHKANRKVGLALYDAHKRAAVKQTCSPSPRQKAKVAFHHHHHRHRFVAKIPTVQQRPYGSNGVEQHKDRNRCHGGESQQTNNDTTSKSAFCS